jgi:gluconate 2-dehydrogenase gamma chain
VEPLSRRTILTRSLAAGLAAAFAPEIVHPETILAAASPVNDLNRLDWKPVFLTAHQNETLIRLSELIIPATETPGAKEALVNRFLDKLMALQPEETQKEFLKILGYLDEECQKRYHAYFVDTPEPEQIEFLTFIAYPHSYPTWATHTVVPIPGNTYFNQMKGWISGAYYTSEIGLKELGWNGSPPHGDWQGCEKSAATHTAEMSEDHEHRT